MTTQLLERPRRPADFPAAIGYPRVRQPRIVTTAPRRCLAIDGTEAPGGPEYEAAMGALYGATYSLIYLLRERGLDAHASPPECLWERRSGAAGWSTGPEAFDPAAWRWTLVMPVPEQATETDVASAVAAAARRQASPALERVRLLEVDEGLVVEAMHVGPYATEPMTIEAMQAVAAEAGLEAHGPHHEVYLGDPYRTAPEHLRTVLRQPVRSAAT